MSGVGGKAPEMLGYGGSKCLSKVLLEHLSPGTYPPLSYRKFLESCLNLKMSQSNLAKMPDTLLGKFYLVDNPMEEPCYFSLHDGDDLCRLEWALDLDLVLTRPSKFLTPEIKLYDRRVYGRKANGVRFFQIRGGPKKKEEELFEVWVDYDVRASEFKFINKCSGLFGSERCLERMVWEALSRELEGHVHPPEHCRTLSGLIADFRKVSERLGTGLVLASHQRSKIRGQSPFCRKNQVFNILAATECEKNTPVVCLTSDLKYAYRLNESYAKVLLGENGRKRNESYGHGMRQRITRDDCQREMDEVEEEGIGKSTTSAKNGCDCDCCRDSEDFVRNMARRGPQKLYKVEMSGFDHLKFLGLFDNKTESVLLRASDLSIGSFDTEALTLHLDGDPVNSDLDPTVDAVSRKRLPRVALARQTPVLLSWCDNLRHSLGLPPHVYRIDEEDRDAFVGDFVEDLLLGRDEAFSAKQELLSELFSWLEVFKVAHHRHHGVTPAGDEEGEVEEEERKRRRAVREAYRLSVFGIFESHLEGLARRYVVFGLNAEGYDLPLLTASIVVYLRSTGKSKIFLNREGSKVRSLSFEGISLREAKKLVAPGFSLDSLASMCGLDSEMKKMKFPFDKMTSVSFLDEPTLPEKASDWVNTLDPKRSISQEEVDKIRAEFTAKGHASVGSYLREYLEVDVLLLLKSMTRLCASFYEQLGVHPADSNKWTVGSLAFLATQLYHARNKQVGTFTANNALLYSVCMDSSVRKPQVSRSLPSIFLGTKKT
jgi:hypothetical protein